jgi:hypothetical protein
VKKSDLGSRLLLPFKQIRIFQSIGRVDRPGKQETKTRNPRISNFEDRNLEGRIIPEIELKESKSE